MFHFLFSSTTCTIESEKSKSSQIYDIFRINSRHLGQVKTVAQQALTIRRENIHIHVHILKTILKEINNAAKYKYINVPQLIELAFSKTEKDSL